MARYLRSNFSQGGGRPKGAFYGENDGYWIYSPKSEIRWHREWDWAMHLALSSKNNWKNLMVDRATEHHRGFMKALNKISQKHPEILSYWISFDGPWKLVSDLVTVRSQFDWSRIIFLHGTSSVVYDKFIKTGGLKPRGDTGSAPTHGSTTSAKPSLPDRVYLSTQEGTAKFAAYDAARSHGGQPLILQIQGINGALVAPDEDSKKNTAVESLALMGAIAYIGTIPASKIKPFKTLSENHWQTFQN